VADTGDLSARIDVRTLRDPVLRRRLSVVGRASALARPVVSAVVEALLAAVR
jgi:hypothetical protein